MFSFKERVKVAIRDASLSIVDTAYLITIDGNKDVSAIENKPGYKELSEAFVFLFDTISQRGVPKKKLAVNMIAIIEDLVKSSVQSKVLKEIDATEGFLKELDANVNDTERKLEEAKKRLLEIASSGSQEQFKQYLMYAADRFGTALEKRSVKAIVSRIGSNTPAKKAPAR